MFSNIQPTAEANTAYHDIRTVFFMTQVLPISLASFLLNLRSHISSWRTPKTPRTQIYLGLCKGISSIQKNFLVSIWLIPILSWRLSSPTKFSGQTLCWISHPALLSPEYPGLSCIRVHRIIRAFVTISFSV